MPWEEGATKQGGLKGRERSARRLAPSSPGSRGLSGRLENRPVYPGHRPPASALGWNLPARWAGFDRSSKRRLRAPQSLDLVLWPRDTAPFGPARSADRSRITFQPGLFYALG